MRCRELPLVTVSVLGLCFVSALFCACSVDVPLGSGAEPNFIDEVKGESYGAAASINGETISEDDVTAYVSDYRYSHGLTDDQSWVTWLDETGQTPSSIRESAIDFFARGIVLRQAANSIGIEVSSAEVDAELAKSQEDFASQSEWEESLKMMGLNESSYRLAIESSLYEQKIKDSYSGYLGDDDLVLEYANAYAYAYDGAKKSSCIEFSSDDYELANSILINLRSGDLSFRDAASKYSIDQESKSSGGDMGWDVLNILPSAEYSGALAELEVGQISDLIVSGTSIYIIKCTDMFVAPGEINSIDQLPEEFQQSIFRTIDDSEKNSQFALWLDQQIDSSDIVIFGMPNELPYDIDDNVDKD